MQWLDAASAEVLAFAARRAQGQEFHFMLSRRPGSATRVESALGRAGLHTAEVGPLSLTATRQLLSQRLGLTLPPRTLQRLFDATQGNPLLGLELGRALAGGRAWPIGAEPPVADLAGNPFGARVAQLPAPARRALLATALSGRVSLPQLMAVADPTTVEELVAFGLLISDGERVRLEHPLLAVAARAHSRVEERQALHLALADATLTEHWNGSAWTVVPSPALGPASQLRSVRGTSASDVWAVGSYFDDTANMRKTLILHWDGRSWTQVTSPSPGQCGYDGQFHDSPGRLPPR